MQLRCVIIDDEPLAVEVMSGFVKKIPNVEVLATFNDALLATNFVKENKIDFLLLDIEMPKLSGLDFLRNLVNPPFVIITSANKNYALEGFELNVVDYILKPIVFSRLVRAVNKVADVIATQQPKVERTPLKALEGCVLIKENKKMVRVKFNDILYLESVRDYVKVFTTNRTVITKQNLSYFEKMLNPNEFIRVHRSFIVSINHITAFSSSSVEVGEIDIPLGRLYKEESITRFEKLFETI